MSADLVQPYLAVLEATPLLGLMARVFGDEDMDLTWQLRGFLQLNDVPAPNLVILDVPAQKKYIWVPEKRNSDNDTYYFDSYSRLAIHREMIEDPVRTDSYRRAIEENARIIDPKLRWEL